MMRWLLTYADMITLLMVFFIVLYAISQVDKMKYQALMRALRQVLTGKQVLSVEGSTKTPQPPPVIADTKTPAVVENAKLMMLAKQIEHSAKQAGLSADVSVTVATVGVRVSFLNGVLFQSGRATVRRESYPILNRIANLLNPMPNNLVVEGYTDSRPIHTARYHSNWDLSAIRSTRVIEYLIGRHVAPQRFAAEAFSKYRPIASNKTAAGRQDNRRVDLVVLRAPTTAVTAPPGYGHGGPAAKAKTAPAVVRQIEATPTRAAGA